MLPFRFLLLVYLLACSLNAAAKDSAFDQTRARDTHRDQLNDASPALTQAQSTRPAPEPVSPRPSTDAVASPPRAAAPEQAPAQFWQRDTLTGDWGGLRSTLRDAGIELGLLEQSEIWASATGGLRRGVVYDGLTTGSISLDLDKLAGWTGATVFVSAYQIHGHGPSEILVGNLQLVSNLEASRDTKLYALWIQQTWLNGKITIRIGQEGANDQMMVTQYGALFLNSSFGFPALSAVDLPSGGPNFPIAAPFVRGQYQATDQITLVGAVFSGDPAPPGTGDPQLRDRGGDTFRLDDHALAFTEFWYAANQQDGAPGLPGTYKLGAWYHSGHFADQLLDTNGRSLASPASNRVPRNHSTAFALYGIVDQMVWKKPGSHGLGVGVFLQVMGAPSEYNLSNVFVEAGMNWKGPFEGREGDVFGFGVSYLGISPAARHFGRDVAAFKGVGSTYGNNETVVEATYLIQVAPWLTLQPDLQIVINPGAGIPTASSTVPLKTSVVGGAHASIVF